MKHGPSSVFEKYMASQLCQETFRKSLLAKGMVSKESIYPERAEYASLDEELGRKVGEHN